MGYSNIRERRDEVGGGWRDSLMSVFHGFFGNKQEKPCVNISKRSEKTNVCSNPYAQKDGDVALAFRIGGRYYHAGCGRVFECVAVKGKKARSVACSCLDKVEETKALLVGIDRELYTWLWHKVRVDGGVETSERGNIRADRFATDEEVAHELEHLSKFRERLSNRDGTSCVSFSITARVGEEEERRIV